MPRYSFSVSQSNRATGVVVFFHSVAFLHIHQDHAEHTEPQPVRRRRNFYWWFRPWCFPGAWTLLRILQRHVNRLFYGFQRGGSPWLCHWTTANVHCYLNLERLSVLPDMWENLNWTFFFGIFNFISFITCYLQFFGNNWFVFHHVNRLCKASKCNKMLSSVCINTS